MTTTEELIRLEHDAWTALSTSGEAAADFYGEVLADEVLMLLPGPMVIDDRAEVVASMNGPSWKSFALSDERVVPLGPDAAIVAYRAHAERGDMVYDALLNSTYVRQDGAWRLVLHQQTPV